MVQQTQTAFDTEELYQAIYNVDTATQAGSIGAYTIDIASNITLSSDLPGIVLGSGSSLTIIGGDGITLDGDGGHRGLFAYQGIVNIESLTIADARAVGGAGGTGSGGGGGGAGLGGGLFVGASADVTLIGVGFTADAATGGAGGVGVDVGNGGGGGGLGGPAATRRISAAAAAG